jgi:tetrahydromethanopterin S-methyltransferase subunit G
MSTTTEIEKKNLEAHVEICAERYKNLETKIDNLEGRMDGFDERLDKVEEHLVDIKNAVTNKVEKQSDRTITILLSVFGIVLTALIGIFASNLLN